MYIHLHSSLPLQNHLDLEAVLWLESYLKSYLHTIIVVSHDRSFLNEVCTDTIEFKKKKLTYFKGDYDTYVKTSHEMVKNQMRVYQVSSILFCFYACWKTHWCFFGNEYLILIFAPNRHTKINVPT